MPAFLRAKMQSNEYTNKNNPNYANTNLEVENYLQKFYPGTMEYDATGRMVESTPDFDMTVEQFRDAQKQIEDDFDEAKAEAEAEIEDSLPEGASFDIDEYVVLDETIDVRVLGTDGRVYTDHLEIYEIDIPENLPEMQESGSKKWIWHTEGDDGTCDECEALDGEEFENEDEVPDCLVHPNCKCWVEEVEMDEDGNEISRTRVAGAKLPPLTEERLKTDEELSAENAPANNERVPEQNNTDQGTNMTADEKFEAAFERLREPEGGYTDGRNQVRDEPTNMGIKQSTLDSYNNRYPDGNFPENVRDITREQAREIYRDGYWDNTRIPEIENDRIRNAVFDMGVMSGQTTPTRTVQNTLNNYVGTSLRTDGNLGPQTIRAINSIPENQINGFMNALIENRMESLRSMRNWPTAQGGWTTRTMAY